MNSPRITTLAALILFCVVRTSPLYSADQVQYVEPSKPYSASPFLKKVRKAPVSTSGTLLIPLITWAADGVTVSANNGLDPAPGTPLAKAIGGPVKLEVIDDFDKQVENYITGKSAFLRGTADMIALVAQTLKAIDPGLDPVVIFQLSTSTGADGFVARGISTVGDLKGKTIVTQISGPHLSLISNMLRDAGLTARDVNIKFVNDITAAPDWKPTSAATDPANAFRRDPQLIGATCISPDILALTGGTEGTGGEGTVKGAKPLLTTKTASEIIFDVYAVRKDFFEKNQKLIESFQEQHLKQQEYFRGELDNIAKKKDADKDRLTKFVTLCKPLAKIFNNDEGAVYDYIQWVGLDLALAGSAGNKNFFEDGNPVGFNKTTAQIQVFFKALGLIKSPVRIAVMSPGGKFVPGSDEKFTDETTDVNIPTPADLKGKSVLFSYAFKFPAQASDISWQSHQDVFARIHEKVSRYGGAAIELRGHADNFFYNYVAAKVAQGKTEGEKKNDKGVFEKFTLPNLDDLLKDADSLSHARADAVKNAYAQYVHDKSNAKLDDSRLSRFVVSGKGLKDPVEKNPLTKEERAKNMRTEMFIIAVESELPARFGVDDLK